MDREHRLGTGVRLGFLAGGLCAVLASLPWNVSSPAKAAPERAACAALGRYTVVPQGWRYVVNAPPPPLFPSVTGGTAVISHYTGCGSPTTLTITTSGSGALLQHPVKPFAGNQLRIAGDILLRFSGTAHQDPQAPADPRAVRLSGTAVYVHVTTKGVLHGTRRLAYASRTVTVANVPATLKVTTDLKGAFSLNCVLPGPKIGKVQSQFSFYVLGVRNPSAVKANTAPSRNL